MRRGWAELPQVRRAQATDAESVVGFVTTHPGVSTDVHLSTSTALAVALSSAIRMRAPREHASSAQNGSRVGVLGLTRTSAPRAVGASRSNLSTYQLTSDDPELRSHVVAGDRPLVVGRFAEFGHGSDAPSVADAVGDLDPHDRQLALAYLENGVAVNAVPGFERDVLDDTDTGLSPSLLTDGQRVWRRDLIHYVRKYSVGLGARLCPIASIGSGASGRSGDPRRTTPWDRSVGGAGGEGRDSVMPDTTLVPLRAVGRTCETSIPLGVDQGSDSVQALIRPTVIWRGLPRVFASRRTVGRRRSGVRTWSS